MNEKKAAEHGMSLAKKILSISLSISFSCVFVLAFLVLPTDLWFLSCGVD